MLYTFTKAFEADVVKFNLVTFQKTFIRSNAKKVIK